MNPLQASIKWLLCTTLALCGAAAVAADGWLWIDGARPSPQALQAVDRLASAASHGLDPQDYGADVLRRQVTSAFPAVVDARAAAAAARALSWTTR